MNWYVKQIVDPDPIVQYIDSLSVYQKVMTPKEKILVFGDFPDQPTLAPLVVINSDDNFVKKLLVEHNRSHCLEPRPELPLPLRYRCYWGDENYFYCAIRFIGYANETENGYSIIMIDRQTCSTADALKIFADYAKEGSTGPDVISRVEALNLDAS